MPFGQIWLYDQWNLLGNGVCINHPSLPVVAAAAVNPILGILALGNAPLIVTLP